MAAGMGSRFGGLKQVEPMNKNGEFIIDYSIYDAIRCGFDKVVFIIKEENYNLFRETVGKRIESKIKVEYVFQKLENLPEGYSVPEGREKPWGTAHAILVCKNCVHDDFVIINADDFYGYDAFRVASEFIKNKTSENKNNFGLISYKVKNTLSENGATKRGVCYSENGRLSNIIESSIEKIDDQIIATPLEQPDQSFAVDKNSPVSMNMWCFTPKLFDYLEQGFVEFLDNQVDSNPLKSEYLIPSVVAELINSGEVDVDLKTTKARWYGVTYREDKPQVVQALKDMTEQGIYPENLWDSAEKTL